MKRNTKTVLKILVCSLISLIVIGGSYLGIWYYTVLTSYNTLLEETTHFGSSWKFTCRNKNTMIEKELLISDHQSISLFIWFKGIAGEIDVSITDHANNELIVTKGNALNGKYSVPLQEGLYTLRLHFKHYTGLGVLFYRNFQFLVDLPQDNYTIIEPKPSEGFHWEYILYLPEHIQSRYLLVMPNNTGKPTPFLQYHKEAAKRLIVRETPFADALGTPVLVPIFPRPSDDLYTHNLDRDCVLLTHPQALKRLDLQLLAMIQDAKALLAQKQIHLEQKILLSGFSASGTFCDRFTYLHPSTVKAAALGGGQLMIPMTTWKGENLPYPVGVFDYEQIMEKPFDIEAFSQIHRYVYMGTDDEGGWETDQSEVLTGKEYYNTYKRPVFEQNLQTKKSPLAHHNDNMTELQEEEIKFRIYDGNILLDQFMMIQALFEEMGVENTQFMIYKGIGHKVTSEMEEDMTQFFTNIINE